LHGGRLELKSTLGEGTEATAIFPHERLVYDLDRTSPRNAA
jgi:signal transduction histidine kinase